MPLRIQQCNCSHGSYPIKCIFFVDLHINTMAYRVACTIKLLRSQSVTSLISSHRRPARINDIRHFFKYIYIYIESLAATLETFNWAQIKKCIALDKYRRDEKIDDLF